MTQEAPNSGTNGSTLDRRRETLRERQATSAARRAKVASLDEALEANAVERRTSEASLQATLDRVAGLKKALKAENKKRDKLRAARKDARDKDAKATQRAEAAEAKYDRAVLADMLRREKNHDLAAHEQDQLEGPSGPEHAAPQVSSRAAAAGLPAADTDNVVSNDDAARRGRRGGRRTATRATRAVTTPRAEPAS